MSEKYISASAFKKLFECDKEAIDAELEKYAEKYNLDDAGKEVARYVFYGVIDIINESIDSIPAADVEPVVRCKDCRYFDVTQTYLCDMHHRAANEDDYCSYGIRKMDSEKEGV